MARMRYVIKNPAKGYYDGMIITGQKPVKFNGILVGHEQIWRPTFNGMQHMHAAQFNTKADAESQLANEQFGAPESFAGCFVEPNTSEHEPE